SPHHDSSDHLCLHSHYETPAQEYSGFDTGNQPALNGFNGSVQQRPTQPQIHPLIMPPWPSMLNGQAHPSCQPIYPQPVQPTLKNQLHTPILATFVRYASPRKTLTKDDRKPLCQYARDKPNAKQTEIGAIFGVDRRLVDRTVSKVLRQIEKRLMQEGGSDLPVKRTKGRSPDIRTALAVWAKNRASLSEQCEHCNLLMADQERKSLPLIDELIRDKAQAFSAVTKAQTTFGAIPPRMVHFILEMRRVRRVLSPTLCLSLFPRTIRTTSPVFNSNSRKAEVPFAAIPHV
ncbi:hypothetical protein D0865_10003, partial [Hortaea werneckii]